MGNSRNTGYLQNAVKVADNGDISLMHGSTMLMQISSSGAITTTGVISGSNALSASYAATASFVTTAQTASFVTLAQTASFVANAQSASNAVSAQTASFANAFTVAGTLTAQTLVVQTITSSVDYVTGSTRFGSLLANTHVFTGSVLITGSVTSQGGFILGNSQAISPTGSIGYNNAVGVFIYGKSGSEADFRLYNASGLTAMSVTAGTQNINFNGGITSKTADIVAGTSAAFAFGIDHQSTFAFGSTNGRRVAVLRNSAVDDNGLQFGFDTTDKTGIIAGSATSAGAGIDFYTYNGSAWGNRMRLTSDGKVGIGTTTPKSYSILTVNGQTVVLNNIGIDIGQSFRLNNYYNSGTVTDRTISTGYAASIGIDNTNGGFTFNMSSVTASADSNITTTERMRINSSGSVGIGTTNPLTRVHILGTSGGDLIRFDGGVNTKFLFKVTGGADDPFTIRRNHPSGGDLDIMSLTYSGKVGIGLTNPSATFHNKGSFITENSNSRHYGEAKTFVFQSSFNNPTIDLITINSTSAYGAVMIRVTAYQNTVSTSRSNIHVGYANWAADVYPTVNKGIIAPTVIAQFNGCTNVGTLAWSGNTLQYTSNRHTNYDGYVIVVEWGANIDHNAAPTYGGNLT